MKYYELDDEEKKILNDFDNNEFVSVDSLAENKKLYHAYAKETLQKTKNINIRLSAMDLQRIRIKAARAGIPYQTLLSLLIHQYVNEEVEIRV